MSKIHPTSNLPEEKTTHPSMMTKMSGMASSMLQSFHPLKSIHQHLSSVHFYVEDPSRQVVSHHFCAHLSEDVRQCLIYDGNSSDSKIIGVEYIISDAQFDALPANEKPYWHSHQYEVCSGILSMPGLVPDTLELSELKKLKDTYGKTWHFWQVDRGDPLPYGPAKLMGAFTADGQVNTQLIDKMDLTNGGEKLSSRREYRTKKGLLLDPISLNPSADKFKGYSESKVE
jgi:hypothetical protein